MNNYVVTWRTNYGISTAIIQAPTKEIAEDICDSEESPMWSNYKTYHGPKKIEDLDKDEVTGVLYCSNTYD